MSAFIMSEESTATLANVLEAVLNMGFNRFGFAAPKTLHDALRFCCDRYGFYKAQLIYTRLRDLNRRAVEGRYGRSEPSPIDALMFPNLPSIVTERKRKDHHEDLQPWHYRFCKLLDCFIYQCSEDATREDPLFLALMDFSCIYKSFLVHNTDLYAAQPWG